MLIFGLGYTTTGLARQAQQQGWQVTSTSRQPERFERIAGETHRALRFDPAARHSGGGGGGGGEEEAAAVVAALRRSRYVVSSIPPLAAPLYDPVLQAQLRAVRAAFRGDDDAGDGGDDAGRCAIRGLAYLSSTGVYGDAGGGWVDETSETRTATVRGVLRADAERAWAALARELRVPLTVLRLGGIYGPRRSVISTLQAAASGPVSRPSAARRARQRFTSRCHVADVVQACLADAARRAAQRGDSETGSGSCSSSSSGSSGGGYDGNGDGNDDGLVDVVNVVDDEPAPRGDVEAFARKLLGLQPPGGEAGEGSSERGSSSSSSSSSSTARGGGGGGGSPSSRAEEPLEEKRVRNGRLKGLLGVQLRAPTYREGLSLVAAGDLDPFAAEDLACLYGD